DMMRAKTKKVKAAPAKKPATSAAPKKAESSSDESSEDDSSDEEEEPQKKKAKDESFEEERSEDEPAKPQAIKKAAAKKDSSSNEEESSENESSDEYKEPKTAKKNTDVEMVDAPSTKKAPQTPATPHETGTKTIFMGNLSFSIEKNDIINFFKDVGEVAEVRFAMRDERFAGYGHVEFTTPDAAQKDIELNGSYLLGLDKSGGQGQGLSIFVRGFGEDNDFDSLRATLEVHFGGCEEILNLVLQRGKISFIDFADRNGFNKALELSGTKKCVEET
ncbi:nucleotide-binding alpha-beta plait domain-containing protein, partial [Tanacetum coccineum]